PVAAPHAPVETTTTPAAAVTPRDSNAVVGFSSSTAITAPRPDSGKLVAKTPPQIPATKANSPSTKKGQTHVEPAPETPRPQSNVARSREEAPVSDEVAIRQTLQRFATTMAN